MACNLRSLLVAAIFLSNCITWTASRHHYTHNVSGHRSRHRRQGGAGLFLPGTFVIPGGDGEGWGEWGAVSPCSRTCGGGVAHQKRICLQLGPDGQPQCTGGDTKYFSCHTQDCPDGSIDFRAQQCSEFNDKDYRGVKYEWIPFTSAPNPCELNCMPRGDHFYYRHVAKVIDGTRCNDDSYDVCVDGECQPVGCDLMLGSSAREDKCRECRGTGASCHTASGSFDSQDYSIGYNDILLIPEGSTNIVIEEIAPSNNYLALRSSNGTYYLNGYYRIDFPKSLVIAGALWHYERDHYGLASPDRLRCSGPTKEPLYLSLYLQGKNVGIKYEYSVPNSTAPPTNQSYHWVHDSFTPCSLTCGGGYQNRNVTCHTSVEMEQVDDALCDEGLKPVTNQTCNTQSCPARWVEGPWSNCSQLCGQGGVRSRNVSCERVIANGYSSIVNERECSDTLGSKPELSQKCNEDTPCPKWFVGPWKKCDRLCGEGKESRQVICHVKINGRVSILPDKECAEEKPEEEKKCTLSICEGTDWVFSSWVGCDSCLSTHRTRRLVCATNTTISKVVDDSFCSYHNKPLAEEPCPPSELPTCTAMWYATQWSKCSAECGEGVKKRKVFCGVFENDAVVAVNDSKCDAEERYHDTKPCSIPIEHCPEQWYTGAWRACSETCGKGLMRRKTMCFKGDDQGTCTHLAAPDTTNICNKHPCTTETSTTPVITSTSDGLDYCEYDEYEEEGLDLEDDSLIKISTLPSDALYSGSGGSFAETESTLIDGETGSGLGSYSTLGEDLIITEGSGSTSSSDDLFISNSETSTDDAGVTNSDSISGTTETNTGSTVTELTPTTEENSTTLNETVMTVSTLETSTTLSGSTDISTSSESSDQSTDVSTSASDSSPASTPNPKSGSSDITTLSESNYQSTEDSSSASDSSPVTPTSSPFGSTDITTLAVSDDQSTDVSTSVSDSSPVTTSTSQSGSTDATTLSESIDQSTEHSTSASDSSPVTTPTSLSGSTDITTLAVSDDQSTDVSTSVSDSSPVTTSTLQSGSTDATTLSESIDQSTEHSTSASDSSPVTTPTSLTGSTDITSSSEQATETGISVSDSSVVTTTESESSRLTTLSESVDQFTETSTLVSESLPVTISTLEPGSTVITTSSESIDQTIETSTLVSDSSSITTTNSESESSVTQTETSVEAASTPTPETTVSGSETSDITTSSESIEQTSDISTPKSESSSDTATMSKSETTTTDSFTSSSEPTTEESTDSQGSSTELVPEVSSTTVSETSSGTREGSVTTTEDTEVPISTTERIAGLSTSTPAVIFTTPKKMCKPRRKSKNCKNTTFGCCPDMKTAADGPFALGCKIPRTCHETKYGCCPDGVSPSQGDDYKGCVPPPCTETLYGCCASDNTIAAEGNDQEGCPDPTPACKFSNYGCCADNVTEAIGPEQLGCPEKETTVDSVSTSQTETSTVSEASSVSETGTSDVTETETSTVSEASSVSETGTSEVTESELSTISEASSVGETGTSGVTETETSTMSGASSVSESETSGIITTEISTISEATGVSETGTSNVTETETSTISEASSASESETSGVTETSAISEASSVSETGTTSASENVTSSSENDTTTIITELTTILEHCSVSEFGCCYDNETAATEANGLGCPCNATEFDCCPDGESPAQGPDQQGCEGDCINTLYGCCSDGQTPAHGPDFEGCCLLTAFGCCLDNRKPAEGPHLEGCGCQFSLYGCCPDRVTAAAGPDNKGCGCQYTQHGCCPDRHAEAIGPNYEGCPCSTFQYGCCDDGITVATGPGQQGCNCRESKYGCCGDGETPANSPDASDCTCAASKFGCCPDGTTEATGPKFLGCTDVPEDKQAVCSLSKDSGSCHDYKVFWFYDLTYGGCTQFWYGGCEGNGNRFATKEDCEDVCVHPAPKDVCKLPEVKGACEDDKMRWHYDSAREQCTPFRYSGCLGNANNFDSRELCQAQCEPDTTTDQCSLPIEEGSCAGNYSRWGYSRERSQCLQFVWGGCEGNANRFRSEAACLHRCTAPGTPRPRCTEAQDAGNCTEKEALWSFNQPENRCVPFYYSGCGGNDNRFDSRTSCQQTCPSAYVPDKCTLPYAVGDCSEYRERWFFDTSIQRCRQFPYGGCGGNGNNFETEVECAKTCSEALPTTTTIATITRATTVATPATAAPQSQPAQPPEQPREDCLLEIDVGPCTNYRERWAYDSAAGKCKIFTYGGCGGNRNNYPNEEYCNYYCPPLQDICQLPMVAGPCSDSVMSWFYNSATGSCSQFTYGGCEGNDNRFESREACESRCRTGPPQTTTVASIKIDDRIGTESDRPECKVSTTLEACSTPGAVWFYNPATYECIKHENQDSGYQCRTTGVFPSQEACERSCKIAKGVDVCSEPKEAGPCASYEIKVFYNQEGGFCDYFYYGGCHGNGNRFSTIEECEQLCQRPNPTELTTTTVTTTTKFTTAVTTTTPTLQLPGCVTPSSLERCGEAETVFYYDSDRRTCVESDIGGCRHANSYRTEEECERSCGPWVGLNVCEYNLDPGPCHESMPKYYWEPASGKCLLFGYGGCGGGPNRFSEINECMEVCGSFGPAPACLELVDTGSSCTQLSSARWYYDPSRADCVPFVYQGCGGNGNNFHSYDACTNTCIIRTECTPFKEECKRLRCEYSVSHSYTEDGCTKCACAPPPVDCEPARQHCETLSCPYGMKTEPGTDGCERCQCNEDPCTSARCSSTERCVAQAYRDPSTQTPQYSAKCVQVRGEDVPRRPEPDPRHDPNIAVKEGGKATLRCLFHSNPPPQITWRRGEITIDGNVNRYRLLSDGALEINSVRRTDSGVYICVADNGLGVAIQKIHLQVGGELNETICEEYTRECEQLKCEYNVQRKRLLSGCTRCSCVPLDIDCAPFRRECEQLKCEYGVSNTDTYHGCPRCRCAESPCATARCAADERCAVLRYRDASTGAINFTAECRRVNKPGMCPVERADPNEVCRDICTDDASCRGSGKCCRRGCSRVCLVAVLATAPPSAPLTTTHAPELLQAPKPIPRQETTTVVSEGGKATLRCLFHSNPPPLITWQRGEVTIDGNIDRYRLLSDGALEIVSLRRTDSGVYICVADNGLGTSQQEVQLMVSDPVPTALGIAGDVNAVVTGVLGEPLTIRCLAYGYPPPDVYWFRGQDMVPFNDPLYLARGNTLLIRNLAIDTLGNYTCQASNLIDRPVSWDVAVKAYRSDGLAVEHKYLVPPTQYNPARARVPASAARRTPPTPTPATTTTTEMAVRYFNMPVAAHVQPPSAPLRVGDELTLTCEVDGFPNPEVFWSKNNVRLNPDDRISITGDTGVSRLTVARLVVSDGGLYACHARNDYSADTATTQIAVKQEVVVPEKCTDNQYFANCPLIVRSNYCRHSYYGKFCCKSCVEAGQLAAEDVMLSDEPSYRRK